jgi:hypothetical protein
MTKIAGSGSESGSISQRHGTADPDPDPHQNVMDPEHWYSERKCKQNKKQTKNTTQVLQKGDSRCIFFCPYPLILNLYRNIFIRFKKRTTYYFQE